MRSTIIIVCLVITSCIANAQQNYAASLIPKNLLSYASDVIRDREESVEVKDLDNVIYRVKEAITVLNKNGDNLAHIVIEHDKNNVIKNIKGTVYNELGVQTGKFSESDFDDVSAGNNFSLFEDVRLKHYLPNVTEYPYTIVYEYEERSKQSLYFDEWKPNPETGVSVEKSSYTFSCKPDFNIRYKETNIADKAVIGTNAQGEKTYSWQFTNLKAVKYEPYSPYKETYLSGVMIAPEKFTYFGYSGSFTNWQQLGKWQYDKLVAGRQALSPETIAHIKEITKDIADPKLKAKKIYEYMQSKTHYISVQIGIGGFQPFLADDVDKQNYGDCKALVNYTQALLKAVNIDSYYCVVEANDDYNVSLLPDFASMDQANHIILCLPFKNDTTWADCTSQTIPFGYLGEFTDDRLVLACSPEGGKLMRTPKYTAQTSVKSRKANFTIAADGTLNGTISTLFKGTDYEYRDNLIDEPKDEQYKMLQHIYPINNLEIESLNLKQDKSFDPSTKEDIKLNARDYASLTDGKYYFTLNVINRIEETPKQVRNRINDVYITRGYTDEDEIIYTIPQGYVLEKEPLNMVLDKPFGNFSAKMEMKGNRLIYKRKLQFIGGKYSKETYADFIDFYQSIVDADEYSVVLAKKTN